MQDLARAIADALPDWSDQPFAFFGHSMGAVAAFETARQLEMAGRGSPVRLFASGRRAPSCRRVEDIHRRDDAGIMRELLRMGVTSPQLLEDEETRAAILPAVRADCRAIETYVPEPSASLACAVTVLVGDSDPQTTFEEALAWRDHCRGDFDIQVFRGGHFYLDTCRLEVLDAIRNALLKVPN